jgi:putative FmdB family regulatory protein
MRLEDPALLGEGRISNETTHGVLTARSGQDTKADHGTTIGSEEGSDPDSLRSDAKAGSRAGRKPMPMDTFMCERCTKSFEVVLTVAERVAAKVACPTCGGGKVTPQMAIFTAKTSRKS